MQFRRDQLDNGLEVVAECNPQAYSMGLAFFVRTGSRDETTELSGVSHFLEHMLFKGTPTRTAADVNRELDEIGSQSNAFTSEEQTVYYAAVLPEYQEQALTLLADIMRPSLRADDFETEKQVIIEEIYKYDDQPPFGAYERCMAAYFGSHSLGNTILGTVESVGQLTPEAMRGYFDARYSPGNISLVAAGNVDFDALVRKTDQLCGSWPSVKTRRAVAATEGQRGFQRVMKANAAQQYTVHISGAPATEHDDRFAQRLLATILGDDSGSRLFWALVDPGLAEYAGSSTYEFQGTGVTMTYLSCMPEDSEENLDELRRQFELIGKEGVTEDELQLAKTKVCSQLVRRSERPVSRLFSVGNAWVQRHAYQTVRESVDCYRSVTVGDIRRMLDQYPFGDGSTVSVGPSETVTRPW